MKIQETKDYSKFDLHTLNRPVNPNKTSTSDLVDSFLKHGWIPAYPMHVVRNGGGKLKIKAGHHRFETAKRLKIPVKYVVCDDNATLHELEKSTTSWTLTDYLESYVQAGVDSYLYLKMFQQRSGLGLSTCIAILSGGSAGNQHLNTKFKAGKFEIIAPEYANKISSIVSHCISCGIDWATHYSFARAISMFVLLDSFSIDRFIGQVSKHWHMMKKQRSLEDYMATIEEVYNSHAREKQPIAFMAKELSKKRQGSFGRK